MIVCTYSHQFVSLRCVYRRSRLMTNSLFPTTRDRYVFSKTVVARCYTRPILWRWPRHKDKTLNMSHKCCKCTNSRHVKRDGCAQDVQSMYVVLWTQACAVPITRGPSTFKSSLLGVCSVLIAAAPRFFEDIKRMSKITFHRCPFLRKEAKRLRCQHGAPAPWE